MNTHANKIKNYIFEIVSEMEENIERLTFNEGSFCRKRKFDFSTIMKFIFS